MSDWIKVNGEVLTVEDIETKDKIIQRLKEGLEFVSNNLGHPPSPPFPAPIAYCADEARKALSSLKTLIEEGEK